VNADANVLKRTAANVLLSFINLSSKRKYCKMYIVIVTHTWYVSLNLDCQITLKMLYGNLGKNGNFQGNFVLDSDAYFQ
jgi:hypothetical protein